MEQVPGWVGWVGAASATLGVLYFLFVRSKDTTIESLKTQILDLERANKDLKEASPDVAFDRLKKKYDFVKDDLREMIEVHESLNRREFEKLDELQKLQSVDAASLTNDVLKGQREIIASLVIDNKGEALLNSHLKIRDNPLVEIFPVGAGQDAVKNSERNTIINAIVKYIGVERIRQANDASFIRAWNAMMEECRHHPMHPPVPLHGGGIDRLIEVGMVEGREVTPLGVAMIRAAARDLGNLA